MRPALLFGSYFLALISAETRPVVPLFFAATPSQQPLYGSTLGSDSAATTYIIYCVGPPNLEDCGFAGGQQGILTITEGPKTVRVTQVLSTSLTNLGCDLDGTTSAACSESRYPIGQYPTQIPSQEITTTALAASQITFQPVTLVGGAANAGMPKVTGKAEYVLGGAVAAAGLALGL